MPGSSLATANATLHATFFRGCEQLAHLPDGDIPEIALLGRSNVGKSSLLNTLVGQHQLARASRTPGRTRALNLFALSFGPRPAANPQCLLVDCPGYGYAKISRSIWSSWGEMVQQYLEHRRQLRLCILLIDSGLPAQPMDLDLSAWLRRHRRPLTLVATKWDRLSGNERAVAGRRLEAAFGQPLLPFSAKTGVGKKELWRAMRLHLEPA